MAVLVGTMTCDNRSNGPERRAMKRMSTGQILLLAVLIFLLVLTGIWAVTAWNSAGDVEMSNHGWIALGLGTFFSLLIGCGLMALMFYSNRSGHDDAADPFRRRRGPPAT
jgi:hypothetical protein